MRKILQIIAISSMSISGMAAQAGIISATSDLEQILSPAGIDLNLGQFESLEVPGAKIKVIHEQQVNQLSSDLDVDDTGGNGNNGYGNNVAGTISIGTWVNSYLVHFDQFEGISGSPGDGKETILMGTINFDSAILGIIHTSGLFDDSDVLVGIGGIIYPNIPGIGVNSRGMELGVDQNDAPFGDSYLFAPGGTSVTFTMRSFQSGLDEFRIITAATAPVPVPAAVWLFGSALLGLVGTRRRKVS